MSTRTKARSCTGKQRHPNKTSAERAVQKLIRAGRAYPGQMRVYACDHCGGYHYGHVGRKRR